MSAEKQNSNTRPLWLLIDILGVFTSFIALFIGLAIESVPFVVAAGTLLLFWQREYHRDIAKAEGGRP